MTAVMLSMMTVVSSFTLPSSHSTTTSSLAFHSTPIQSQMNKQSKQFKQFKLSFLWSTSSSNNNINNEEELYSSMSKMKNIPSQLPDSLEDSASIAATSLYNFQQFTSYQNLDLS